MSKTVPVKYPVRVFTAIVVVMTLLMAGLWFYSHDTGALSGKMSDRYRQIESHQNAMSHLREAFPAGGEDYVHAVEKLNTLLIKQVGEAKSLEQTKEHLSRLGLIVMLILLLLAWLLVMRMSRQSRQALQETNKQLLSRTRELDELNHTLEAKVSERTSSLAEALNELNQIHNDLKVAQAQLLQSEKFSAIGQLAAGIAHEINNPIGFINSNLQTLEEYIKHYRRLLGFLNDLQRSSETHDQGQLEQVMASWRNMRGQVNLEFINEDINSLIAESRAGAEKIRKIVMDVRSFASPQQESMGLVKIESVLESMLNIVANELKYKVQLNKVYGEVEMVYVDAQKLGQVFVTLLINAVQSIPHQGTITLKTYMRDGMACVDVSDTGCGISPQHITRIFDPFFTTKAPGQGTGLGLSVGYDIVRKLGGAMTVASRMGEGTTFTVKLPVHVLHEAGTIKEAK